tara:strand:+ start:66 stop:785 length:720 start_codon:yes stop_codon:yes gene_type:complete
MAGERFNVGDFRVYLELQRRNDGLNSGQVNRIPLFVSDISINTNKTVMNMGVPFSGAVTGESMNLAFDIGMAQKTVSLNGVLLGQTISKQKSESVSAKTANLTAYEMAQLISSYVDGSTFQDDQNMNKLIILMPSRVKENFSYHTTGDNGSVDCETADEADLPLIPFTWKNRGYDTEFTTQGTNAAYFTPYDDTADVTVGITGFIKSFSCQFTGTDFPAVSFSLEFEEATVLAENFLDG